MLGNNIKQKDLFNNDNRKRIYDLLKEKSYSINDIGFKLEIKCGVIDYHLKILMKFKYIGKNENLYHIIKK